MEINEYLIICAKVLRRKFEHGRTDDQLERQKGTLKMKKT